MEPEKLIAERPDCIRPEQWRPWQDRRWLRRFRRLLSLHGEELAGLLAEARGVSVAEALATEVLPLAEGARFLEKVAARVLRERVVPSVGRPWWLLGVELRERWLPRGRVLVVAPSNYPLFLGAGLLLPALTAGNCITWKPAPGGEAAAALTARLLKQAGVPEDVLEVTDTSSEAVYRRIDAGVDLVVFTGSSTHGRALLAYLADRLIPAIVELSGCDSVWLQPDADLDLAARSVAYGLQLNHGRTCIAPRRVLLPEDLAEPFLKALCVALRESAQAPTPPTPYRPLRPWPSSAARNVEAALQSGAQVRAVFPEGPLPGAIPSAFFSETEVLTGSTPQSAALWAAAGATVVLSGVTPAMALWSADTFAPICSVVPYRDPTEALQWEAQCRYRLGSTVFGRNVRAAQAWARRLPAPTVSINELIVATADPRLTFGGAGESGFGETRGYGGLRAMAQRQTLATQRLPFRPHLNPAMAQSLPALRQLLQWLHR